MRGIFEALPVVVVGCVMGVTGIARAADDKAPAATPEVTTPDKAEANAPTTLPSGDAKKAFEAYKALKAPQVDMSRRGDQKYIQSYIKERQTFAKQQAELAKQFAEMYPD